jgi:hypothetical protein
MDRVTLVESVLMGLLFLAFYVVLAHFLPVVAFYWVRVEVTLVFCSWYVANRHRLNRCIRFAVALITAWFLLQYAKYLINQMLGELEKKHTERLLW